MWLIAYYPVKPRESFEVYNISCCDPNDWSRSNAECMLNQYVLARKRLYKDLGKPVSKIIGWNNSWFMISEKDYSLKQAIEEFWESFFKYLEGNGEYESSNVDNYFASLYIEEVKNGG